MTAAARPYSILSDRDFRMLAGRTKKDASGQASVTWRVLMQNTERGREEETWAGCACRSCKQRRATCGGGCRGRQGPARRGQGCLRMHGALLRAVAGRPPGAQTHRRPYGPAERPPHHWCDALRDRAFSCARTWTLLRRSPRAHALASPRLVRDDALRLPVAAPASAHRRRVSHSICS